MDQYPWCPVKLTRVLVAAGLFPCVVVAALVLLVLLCFFFHITFFFVFSVCPGWRMYRLWYVLDDPLAGSRATTTSGNTTTLTPFHSTCSVADAQLNPTVHAHPARGNRHSRQPHVRRRRPHSTPTATSSPCGGLRRQPDIFSPTVFRHQQHTDHRCQFQ